MDIQHKTERLRTMMRAYEGPQHTVVAFSLQHGETEFIDTGATGPTGTQISEISLDEMIFEIGSITKVFTAILLCVLTEEGKIDPNAPLCEMSDELAHIPSWITPESLTTHTSALPRLHVPLWKTLTMPRPEDPYAEFSRTDLLAWFSNWPGKPPSSKRRHAYSNFGVGLLGEAMAMCEGKPFVDLLTEKVIAPLGLKDTVDRLDQGQQRRFAQPTNTKGDAVSPWTFQAMAAAGCLRSSARDLAHFADRVIGALSAPETRLDHAICRSARPILGLGPRGGMEPAAQCSGWLSMKLAKDDPGFLYHDGGTGGSTCAIYICPKKAESIAVLSNNGVAANLWASSKLSWSNQLRQAHDLFAAS